MSADLHLNCVPSWQAGLAQQALSVTCCGGDHVLVLYGVKSL